MKKDFLSVLDISRVELEELFSIADFLKHNTMYRPLEGKSAALIFQKPSLRTRVSFEVGIYQLGGYPTYLSQEGVGLGVREKASDVAKLLSRYMSLIIARLFDHDLLIEIAENSTVPVINALTDHSHPCQIVADMYTLRQHKKLQPGMKVVFVGDGNNVVTSWLEMATLYPMHFVLAAPKGYEPVATVLRSAQMSRTSTVEVVQDPIGAVKDADVIYTDVWTSMGQEDESAIRRKAFEGYQVNARLLKNARPDAVVMHCLPAHRDEEITEAVLEGEQSIVFDQAENRLHIQKAILAKLLHPTAALVPSQGERQPSFIS